MNPEFSKRLKETQTVEEFLKVCAEFYDLKNARPGYIAKATLINNISNILTLAGAKPKK